MNTIAAAIMGALGLVAGCFLPMLAERTAAYKCSKKGRPFAPDKRYSGPVIRAVAAFYTLIGWAAAGLWAANPVSAVLLALLWALAFLIAVIDIRLHIIPNELVLVLGGLGLLFQLFFFGPWQLLIALACMIAVMAVFLILSAVMGGGAVGAGDVKLAGAMGLALGYPHLIYGLVAMGLVMGGYCAFGFWAKKLTLRSMLPFAPFMMAGTAASLLEILLNH